jgi:hypothetical protein
MTTANPKSKCRRARDVVDAALAAGLLAVLAPGCLHHPNLAPCPTEPTETECWESTRDDRRGHTRHRVVERIVPDTPCDRVRIEQTTYDPDGQMSERVVDERRCGVVDRRIVDRYDIGTGQVVRTVSTDTNHDDRFDRVFVARMPAVDAARADAAERDAENRTLRVSEEK